MTDNVNNGSRPQLELGDFSGAAGFVKKDDGSAKLAYTPNKKGAAPAAGGVITVDGREWTVVGRESSKFVNGMVVLTLTPA